MIKKIEIKGVHTKIDPKLFDYVNKKIGNLDKRLPHHARESAHAEVFLKEHKPQKQKKYECEVVLHLPHETITISESTLNMFAAVDIAEDSLKNQIVKYRDKHGNPRLHRRVISKLRSLKHSTGE
ncbi:ribosome-associated translation inhibitor RaiA [Candidatus Saccharibacteria bacterium]|jgi:ribosomal subunit interface protein|nr:ribosome-associated translation inhibitor RaiA [Candidatus Saccharibacteria bacterium]